MYTKGDVRKAIKKRFLHHPVTPNPVDSLHSRLIFV